MIDAINIQFLYVMGIKFEKREIYAIEYLEDLLEKYEKTVKLDKSAFVYGIDHRKSLYQKQYEKLSGM